MSTETSVWVRFLDFRKRRWAVVEDYYENGDMHVLYRIGWGKIECARIAPADALEVLHQNERPY